PQRPDDRLRRATRGKAVQQDAAVASQTHGQGRLVVGVGRTEGGVLTVARRLDGLEFGEEQVEVAADRFLTAVGAGDRSGGGGLGSCRFRLLGREQCGMESIQRLLSLVHRGGGALQPSSREGKKPRRVIHLDLVLAVALARQLALEDALESGAG